ncbi:RNA polymerase sigma factor [Salinibacter altiplanensis]|uniref:RNA polymerase sigma factor n=1 Tax=Salinibacter altiplanensis TaxID=1803181 RepID=UPI000C9FEBC6|nr:sigma-70 family RNA polymerase sigma factor [Salinibacter altiplanensis]
MPDSSPSSVSDSAGAPDGPPGDAALQALRNRDPDAVRRWIYGHRDYIEGVLRRYSNDAGAARDLVQEVFFQALRSLPNFRGDAKITTWLHSIAKNVALARYRDDQRRSCLDENTLEHMHARAEGGEAPSYRGPVEEAERGQEHRLLYDAMEELSESYREVLRLRDLEEQSTKEVAEALGLTRVNVRVRLHRARTALRDELESRFDEAYEEVYEMAA